MANTEENSLNRSKTLNSGRHLVKNLCLLLKELHLGYTKRRWQSLHHSLIYSVVHNNFSFRRLRHSFSYYHAFWDAKYDASRCADSHTYTTRTNQRAFLANPDSNLTTISPARSTNPTS